MSRSKLSFQELYNTNPDFRAAYDAQQKEQNRIRQKREEISNRMNTPTEIKSLGVSMKLSGETVTIGK